ncbi:cobalamin biosynthesis protein CobQ [Candidatus Gottesmanbacteria bacterium]|nr:cobalamin biosynthesis protein CobQ [Candidatus Gottesmanbacteria bacterium]
MKYSLQIGWMYPDLMSTYGDRGNIIVLTKRCQWRDIEVNVEEITLETPTSKLETCDLIFMGGAQDRQQKLAGEDFLKRKGPVVKEMVEKGIPALFVCAAYQFVGHYYKPYQGDPIPGAGIFDLYTEHPGDQAKRLIGNVVAELISPLSSRDPAKRGDAIPLGEIASSSANRRIPRNDNTIVGFENHGGRTYLGPKMKPFARVKRGYGNNGEDGYEGAVYKNAIGSYFHGPLLPKNPHIADWLIKTALRKKYQENFTLKNLDDELEINAHEFIRKK